MSTFHRACALALVVTAAALGGACGGGSPPAAGGPSPAPEPEPAPTSFVWQWRQLSPTSAEIPEPRSDGVAVYDPVAERVVIFGGDSAQGQLNDVWAFDLATSTWSRLATSGGPPEPRLGADAVYDPNGHQMVLWAGQRGARFFDDTWVLDLQSLEWRDVSPAQRPQARYGSASVFDPVERRLVQFAGFTSLSRRFQDTQAFDLDTNAWEDLTPPDLNPSVRCLLTAALHEPSRRMFMYAGQRSGPLDDLWTFDLATRMWSEITPAERPEGRLLAASFIDAEERFVVFGGATDAGPVDETWAYDIANGTWTLLDLANPPPAREAPLYTSFESGTRFVVFGGQGPGFLNDLWELRRVPEGN